MADEHPPADGGSDSTAATAGPLLLDERYEVHRQLARGGQAEVYLGRDRLLDRPVAVKMLFPELSQDASFVERFRREATSAANLAHPNIVAIFDWGRHEDTYYIVMEYVEGRSLSEIIRSEGPLHPDRAAEVAIDIAAALGFAHRNGVVHRDVKPGNVMVTPDGQVKVTDFGIAQAIVSSGEADLTQAGAVLGTAAYFSPEQAQGKPLDPRSDLYSLGVVLYEMLTCRLPFTGDTPAEIAYRHVQELPVAPSQHGVDVPPSLEAIILLLLAKDPAQRYPSAEDLRADLRRFREGEPVLAVAALGAAAPEGEEPEGPRKGRIGVLTASLVVLFGLLGGLVFLLAEELTSAGGLAVPDVVGEELEEARERLEGLGFEVLTRFEEHDEVEANVVFGQDPEGGTRADEGSRVTLFVSQGPDAVEVPDVVGVPVDGARVILMEQGFEIEERLEHNPEVPQGHVFSQDPGGGQLAPRGSVVTLLVSQGPEPVEIPDVAGLAEADAAARLGRAGFEVTTREEASDSVPPGVVIRTEPAAGELLIPGELVTMVVSQGRQRAPVPDVVGRPQGEAVAILEQAGFTVAVERQEVPFDSPEAGLVLSQVPGAGSEAEQGAVVAIRVGVPGPPPTTTTVPPTTTTTVPATTTTTTP